MDLKFYLNKFLKTDNIEYYTIPTLTELKSTYEKFLKSSKGIDVDFPTITFNEYAEDGITLKGNNVYSVFDSEDDIPEDFKGIKDERVRTNKN